MSRASCLRFAQGLSFSILAAATFAGVVAPLDNVEMVKAPKAGAVLFDVEPGQRVKAGERLATIVHTPGEPDGGFSQGKGIPHDDSISSPGAHILAWQRWSAPGLDDDRDAFGTVPA